jgi:hypothetical protein
VNQSQVTFYLRAFLREAEGLSVADYHCPSHAPRGEKRGRTARPAASLRAHPEHNGGRTQHVPQDYALPAYPSHPLWRLLPIQPFGKCRTILAK